MEAVPTQANVLHLLASERAKTTGKWQLKLTESDKDDTVWEKSYDFLAHGGKIYADFIPKIEAETRSTLVEALRTAGVKGTKPARKAPTPPGPEIEQALNAVDVVAQFGAVRAAHADSTSGYRELALPGVRSDLPSSLPGAWRNYPTCPRPCSPSLSRSGQK